MGPHGCHCNIKGVFSIRLCMRTWGSHQITHRAENDQPFIWNKYRRFLSDYRHQLLGEGITHKHQMLGSGFHPVEHSSQNGSSPSRGKHRIWMDMFETTTSTESFKIFKQHVIFVSWRRGWAGWKRNLITFYHLQLSARESVSSGCLWNWLRQPSGRLI